MAADDPVSAVLAEIRDRNEAWIKKARFTEWTVSRQGEGDIRRLLAALDAVLKRHRPVQLYGMAEDFSGRPACAHGPDYDGDAHYEGDDGIWYCMGEPTVVVCGSCADQSDSDAWVWPCPTYEDIAGALAGKGNDGG